MTTVPRGPNTRDELDRHAGLGSACQDETFHGKTQHLLKSNIYVCTASRAALAHTTSDPLGSRLPCIDRMCDARPATYMCCGLRDTAGRTMHGWHTGRGTNGRAASCLWRPRVRTLCALDRRSGVHELALKTCSILCNWKKQLPTRKGARATVGGWDDLQLVQGDPDIFILQGWP